jgi:hypothetical protein
MRSIDKMYRYRAFGLRIASSVELAGPVADDEGGAPDLVIEAGSIDYPLPPPGTGGSFDYTAPGGTVMLWPGMAGFRIVGPHHVLLEKYSDASDKLLVFAILGPVMAWVLHLRKLFLMHSSAVVIGGKSVCFVGDKMAGKSTTAASFVRAGHLLVTDDLLVVDPDGPPDSAVRPGYPQVKLTEAAASSLSLENATPLPLVLEQAEKRQHLLRDFHDRPLALGHVFVLERAGTQPEIVELTFAERIAVLTRYNYVVRFAAAPFSQEERARHFSQCARIAERTRVARLRVPHSLEELGRAVDLVERVVG